MNHIEIYIKSTGEPIELGNEIHHIDHDHGNNDIYNLVSLPKKLHKKYHNMRHKFNMAIEDILNLNFIYKPEKEKYLKQIFEFIEVKNEMDKYLNKRNYLIQSYGNR